MTISERHGQRATWRTWRSRRTRSDRSRAATGIRAPRDRAADGLPFALEIVAVKVTDAPAVDGLRPEPTVVVVEAGTQP